VIPRNGDRFPGVAGYSIGQSFEVVGEPSIDPAHQPLAHFQLAAPRYFEPSYRK
jgi:hypothetical protein